MEPSTVAKIVIAFLQTETGKKTLRIAIILIVAPFFLLVLLLSGAFFKGERADAEYLDVYCLAAQNLNCRTSPSIVEKIRIMDSLYLSFYNKEPEFSDILSIQNRMETIYLNRLTLEDNSGSVCYFRRTKSILNDELFLALDDDTREAIEEFINNSTVVYGTVSPIEVGSYRISSPFGMYYEENKYHYGIDLAAPNMTPVYAILEGEVVTVVDGYSNDSASQTSRGNNIVIRHKVEEVNGEELIIYSHYFHLQKDSIKVKKGGKVKTGQHIAGVGSSGLSTGNHLHFAISRSSVITSGFKYAYDPNDWVYIYYP